jgi:hypothetical protein
MRLPRAPGFVPVGGPPGSKDRPALAVGSRAVVAGRAHGSGVMLTDDSGTIVVGTIPDGTEVEVVAWRPRRGGDTRYRVAPAGGGPEGWVHATSLRPCEVVAPPKRVEITAPRNPVPPPRANERTPHAPGRKTAAHPSVTTKRSRRK